MPSVKGLAMSDYPVPTILWNLFLATATLVLPIIIIAQKSLIMVQVEVLTCADVRNTESSALFLSAFQ